MTGKPFTDDDVAKLFVRFITRLMPATGTVEMASAAAGTPMGIWRATDVGDGRFRSALRTALHTHAHIGLTEAGVVRVWMVADGSITAATPAPVFDPEAELVREIGEHMELGDKLVNWVIDQAGHGHHKLRSQLTDRPPHQMTFVRSAAGTLIDPTAEQNATFISIDAGAAVLRDSKVLALTLHSDVGDGVRRVRGWGVTRGTVTALTSNQTRALVRGTVTDQDVFEDAWLPTGISDLFTVVVRDD